MRWTTTDVAPAGLGYYPNFLSESESDTLLEHVRSLDFAIVRFHGIVANRRTAHFGRDYSYNARTVTPTTAIPDFLVAVRDRACRAANLEPEPFVEALVTHYPPGAGIGWHRDAQVFGEPIVGVSLSAPCVMRFRLAEKRLVYAQPLAIGSLYLLQGDARRGWEHSISPMLHERYSITFRPLK